MTENLTIATDSLSSLKAQRKTLNKPHRAAQHRSEQLAECGGTKNQTVKRQENDGGGGWLSHVSLCI